MDNNNQIKKLKIKNQELKKTCDQLKNQLTFVNTKLQKSEQYKSNFFSNITNEIINPFASIIGLTQVIMSTDKNQQDVINELITLVHSEAFNLDLQLRNIFYAAEIESGQFNVENCEINLLNFLNSINECFDYIISKNDFKINFTFSNALKDKNYIFYSDPIKLKLIITNILNIIISYSSKNKNLEINTSIEYKYLTITFININNEVTTKYIRFLYKKISDLNNPNDFNIYSHTLALSIIKSILDIIGGHIDFSDDNCGVKIIIPELKGEITGYVNNENEIYF